MDSREKAILKTLLYSDIFNYPLNKKEIGKYIISSSKVNSTEIKKGINNLKNLIKSKKGYFFLNGRDKIVDERIEKQKISTEKLLFAKRIIQKVSIIPTIKFIGISGALSMKNSELKDDIDFFLITDNKLIWFTRIITAMLLIFLGVYRSKGAKSFKDKICLNMLLSEGKMVLKDKNLYTAHEITQMIPVFDRANTYVKFMNSNSWTKEYLPNFYINIKYIKKQNSLFDIFLITFSKILLLEFLSKFIQKKYMQKKITNEIISEGYLGFHPFDYKKHVLKMYAKQLKKYDLEP